MTTPTPRPQRRGPTVAGTALGVILLTLMAAAVVTFLIRISVPVGRIERIAPQEGYTSDTMQQALVPKRVGDRQRDIVEIGDRFMGNPGHEAAAAFFRERFEEAGLEIIEQTNWTPVPRTTRRDIGVADKTASDGDGFRALSDVAIYPFFPNHMQPMVTPAEGLEGELVLMTLDVLKGRSDFSGCIGLVDAREDQVPPGYYYDWTAYAALGVEAIIIAHPAGFEKVNWQSIVGNQNNPERGFINSSIPINYVRLAASKEIFDYVGQTIRLDVRTEWQHVRHRTVIGALRAKEPGKKALLVIANYDTSSILPDLAPGAMQALEPAIMLQLVEGLVPYRDTIKRDVYFIALGGGVANYSGMRGLFRSLGPGVAGGTDNRLKMAFTRGGSRGDLDARRTVVKKPIEAREADNDEHLRMLALIRPALAEHATLLLDRRETLAAMDPWDSATRTFFADQFQYVLNTIVLETSEPALAAKLNIERVVSGVTPPELLDAYYAAKRLYDKASSAAGYSLDRYLEFKREFTDQYDVRQRCIDRFDELYRHHLDQATMFEQDLALADTFLGYTEVFVVRPRLVPAFAEEDSAETISFASGNEIVGAREDTFQNVLATARERLGLQDACEVPAVTVSHYDTLSGELLPAPYHGEPILMRLGYPCFSLVNLGRSDAYTRFAWPVDLPYMYNVDSLRASLALTGEAVLTLAHGVGAFPNKAGEAFTYAGRVLIANVGQSIVPNYPLKNALLCSRSTPTGNHYYAPGFYSLSVNIADPYGRFIWPNDDELGLVNPDQMMLEYGYTPIACGFGDDGLIAFMKDEGQDGQRLFKSVAIAWDNMERLQNLTVVTFRAAPVALLDLENPQTKELYVWAELLDQQGLTPFRRRCIFTTQSPFMTFIEPHERFFVTLYSGTLKNARARVTRAFMLGSYDGYVLDPTKEIDGPGFLAADTPFIADVAQHVATSMTAVNQKRLDLQNRHAMADDRVNLYHDRSVGRIAEMREPDKAALTSRLEARDVVTYNELNHPVLRRSIREAVIGIVWYLGLLVPFCFFFEKLLFGFPDVRKQIATQFVIFLTAFALLHVLHPAFEMVRSPLMILLGFIIILIAGGINLVFYSKFKENFEELRKHQGRVAAAEVNVMGAIGTAFVLGLNNMHRRRLRTGLTCVTLVLITFVLICFTSVQNDLVEETIAIGKAPYQGVLFKKREFAPFLAAGGIAEEYGDTYDVCVREMYLGSVFNGRKHNPSLDMVYQPDGERAKRVAPKSIVKLAAKEPLRHKITLLTARGWFSPEDEKEGTGACPVLIPISIARRLGITVRAVDGGDVRVQINGRHFRVTGIFDPESLDRVRDLDGQDILPFDIEALKTIKSIIEEAILAPSTAARIYAEDIVICPAGRDLRINLQRGGQRITSVALAMADIPYKQAKATIDSYLERTAQTVFYGLGGVAYRGKRARETQMVGIIDILIPLLIAALTVLNTMRGSVYERRDEILVYNAVGIAPRYVFFMFFAEAAVYAVVGSVLGYIVSQGVGRVLTELGLTGGMNMTFTTIGTIYASLLVAAAVFLSTYFPARTAMQIASPAEESGWDLPDTEGDTLRFNLPFTFDAQDRIAILAFVERYLQDHGEGSAGPFFSSPPEMGLSDTLDALANDAYIPTVRATVWLKPFDLAVSQEIVLSVPVDQETGEFIAVVELNRLSGTHESWMRLNKRFVRLIRRQLLHWRAVTKKDREIMFAEARQLLESAVEVTT